MDEVPLQTLMQRVPQWYGYGGRISGHYSCCPMLGALQSLACENQEEGCCVENLLGGGAGVVVGDEGVSFRSSKEETNNKALWKE